MNQFNRYIDHAVVEHGKTRKEIRYAVCHNARHVCLLHIMDATENGFNSAAAIDNGE